MMVGVLAAFASERTMAPGFDANSNCIAWLVHSDYNAADILGVASCILSSPIAAFSFMHLQHVTEQTGGRLKANANNQTFDFSEALSVCRQCLQRLIDNLESYSISTYTI
jgi:hypothetical protein